MPENDTIVAKKPRNNKPAKNKSLVKALADLEKAKESIAKASGITDGVFDLDLLKRAEKKAAKDIAETLNLPVSMITVTADVLYRTSAKADE